MTPKERQSMQARAGTDLVHHLEEAIRISLEISPRDFRFRGIARYLHQRSIALTPPGASEGMRPALPRGLRAQVFARDGYRCARCGATTGLAIDHIHPFSRGGLDVLENLQVLCMSCNGSKGTSVQK